MIEAKETLTGGIASKQTISGSTNVTAIKIQPELEDITITPTKEQQTFIHENSDGYDKVTVNPMPEIKLQDKEITITENGTQNITADEGYDGLGKVEVTTNIEGASFPDGEYVQDGLIAYFDGRDKLDSNNRWNSRIGNDYFFQSYPLNGTGMKNLKTDNAIVTDGTFSMRNNVDYQKQDYTIELVGLTPNNVNTNFLCFDRNQSTHININRYGEGIFSPQYGTGADATNINEKTINGLVNKRCTMAINIRQTFARGLSTGNVRTLYSVNGCQWYMHGLYALTSASSYKSSYCTLLSYYSNSLSGVSKQGEVNCIRVYNRKLTEEELKHNHEVDKINFNLPE